MSWRVTWTVIAMASLATACASGVAVILSDPVGPPPITHSAPASGKGYLKVFSATESGYHDSDLPYEEPLHADYMILSMDGETLTKVRNSPGGMYGGGPVVVTLQVGAYMVKAPAETYGTVRVPVVILEGRETDVYLDRGWKPGTPTVDDKDLVRLPNGQIVGWRAIAPSRADGRPSTH